MVTIAVPVNNCKLSPITNNSKFCFLWCSSILNIKTFGFKISWFLRIPDPNTCGKCACKIWCCYRLLDSYVLQALQMQGLSKWINKQFIVLCMCISCVLEGKLNCTTSELSDLLQIHVHTYLKNYAHAIIPCGWLIWPQAFPRDPKWCT